MVQVGSFLPYLAYKQEVVPIIGAAFFISLGKTFLNQVQFFRERGIDSEIEVKAPKQVRGT